MTSPHPTICFPFTGEDVGGSHISALKLVAALGERGFRPLVVLHTTDGPLAQYMAARSMPFEAAPTVVLNGAQSGRLATAVNLATSVVPAIRQFVRNRKIDVVHTNDGRIHVAWSIGARTGGARVLWHHRGDPDARATNLLAPLVADHLVTVSRFACPRRPIRSVADRWTVVHSPFERFAPDTWSREACHDALAAELGLAPGTRFLGYFGLLLARKRPVTFVEVVAALRRARPDLPVAGLLFGDDPVGHPPQKEAVRRAARALGIADAIHFMGFRDPVEPCMRGIDALVVPALNEPFGRTLIEAMFLETPVVATNHGGNPEAIVQGETGFLVSPRDAEAFVAPLTALLTDPDLATRISDAARRNVENRFSVDRHAEQIIELYRRITRQSEAQK